MACERFRDALSDAAAGGPATPALVAHLPACDACRAELETLGFHDTGVLPVVPDFTHLDRADDNAVAAFDDDRTNIVFVGRVIPNKVFEDVIRAFHFYRTRHNPRSRLLLVGSYSG